MFFYSLHDALINKDLLAAVGEALDLPLTKEEFMIAFRNYLAESDVIRSKYESTIEVLCSEIMAGGNISQFIAGFTYEERVILKSLNKNNCSKKAQRKILVDRLGESIRAKGAFVGEIAVSTAIEILSTLAGVYVDIKNRVLYRLVQKDNRVVLLNLGEGHYQWFRSVAAGGTRRARRGDRRSTRGGRRAIRSTRRARRSTRRS